MDGHVKTRRAAAKRTPRRADLCEHGLPWLRHADEKLCALDYLNRFVAPNRVEALRRRGTKLYLTFETGEKIECCCEGCGESHGDDREFVIEIEELTLGRRALRFRVEEDGHLVIWFARGDNLHLHRNSLERFRPGRKRRSLHPRHPSKLAKPNTPPIPPKK